MATCTPSDIPALAGKRHRIAFFLNGGIGDTLIIYWYANAIHRKFPMASLFLFPSDRNAEFLARCTRFMTNTHVVTIPEGGFRKYISNETRVFDLVFDCRYVTKVTSPSGRFSAFESRQALMFQLYDKNFDKHPMGNHLHTDPMFSVISRTSGIDLLDCDITLPLVAEDFVVANGLRKHDYVTFSTGTDPSHFKDRPKGTVLTKHWPLGHWVELVGLLAKSGLVLVQLGTCDDPKVEGSVDLRGTTSVFEAAAVIKGAVCNVSTEGGLVWLAKAVGTKSVVMFGPTGQTFFEQSENTNVSNYLSCSPCWWTTRDWNYKCPAGHESAKCLQGIHPETVLIDVLSLAGSRPKPVPSTVVRSDLFASVHVVQSTSLLQALCASSGLQGVPPHCGAENKDTGVYIHGSKHWEYWWVLRDLLQQADDSVHPLRVLDVGSGRGALHQFLVGCGMVVTISDLNFGHPTPSNEGKFLITRDRRLATAFNSAFNLSFPSGLFDVVICCSVLEHLEHKELVLKELLRVVRNGGTLLLTFDFTLDELTAKPEFAPGDRVELFTDTNLPRLLDECGISHDLLPEELRVRYAHSIHSVTNAGVVGLPEGITVGGLVIKKETS